MTRRFLLLLALLIPAGDLCAQLVIRKSARYNIQVENFHGNSGQQAHQIVSRDLNEYGVFDFVAEPGSTFRVRANTDGASITGVLIAPNGEAVLERSYTGSDLKRNAHAFSDDIIFAITGRPGIASGRIVFSGSSGSNREIFAVDYDGGNLVQLTRDNNLAVSPAISPDGSRLAYTSYTSGYPDIWMLNIANGQRQRIYSSPGTNTGAAFSPDGRQLAMSMSFTGGPEIYVGGINGGRARRLTAAQGVKASPTWSPDGSQIAFAYSAGGSPQICVVPTAGGNFRRLNTGHSYCTEPSWSPDGRRLALTVRADGLQVAIYDFSSGQTKVLTPGQDPVWAPDSRHLAFVRGGTLYRMDTESGKISTIVTGRDAKEPDWSR